jgi:hypothetical protein
MTGTIVDANDKTINIQNAIIKVYNWANQQQGSNYTSNSSGVFLTGSLSAGTYSITISADLHSIPPVIPAKDYFSLTVDNIIINNNKDIGRQAICEVLTEPQVRVIVLWGATPQDLDFHVVGPTTYGDAESTPNNRFHVYWSTHKTFDEVIGDYVTGDGNSWDYGDTLGVKSTTSLVQDVRASYYPGYGPEAINLYRHNTTQYSRGIYTYTVDNWSQTTWVPSGSAITMRVYDSLGMAREINFPSSGWSGATPRYWKAIKINIQGIGRTKRIIYVINQFGSLTYDNKTSMDW